MRARCYASTAGTESPFEGGIPIPELPQKAGTRRRQTNALYWTSLLESYLPPKLRLKAADDAVRQAIPLEGTARHPRNLAKLLLAARRSIDPPLDLLSYLGAYQGRWEAVVFLTKAMLDHHQDGLGISRNHFPRVPFSVSDQTLEQASKHAIEAQGWQMRPGYDLSLDELTGSAQLVSDQHSIHLSAVREPLGQILQSLGSMILQAADQVDDNHKAKKIMSGVYEVLAFLHHINVLPKTLYDYATPLDQSPSRKPPTLNMMRPQIMMILSDAEWRAREREIISEAAEVGAKDVYKGHEASGASLQAHVRDLSTGIWLDLVLWICIEGGFIQEAGWILSQVERRSKLEDKTWTLRISTPQQQNFRQALWMYRPELDPEKSRLNQFAIALGIAGSGRDLPIATEARVISHEVILAVLDGLVTQVTSQHTNLAALYQNLTACKGLLERSNSKYDANVWFPVLQRLDDALGFRNRGQLDLIHQMLQWTSPYKPIVSLEPTAAETVPETTAGDAQSAAALGVSNRALREWAVRRDLGRTLRSYQESKRLRGLDYSELQQDEGVQSSAEQMTPRHLQLPVYTQAEFLDFITDAGLFELGTEFLELKPLGSSIERHDNFSDPNLQPAILRFATATANSRILLKVLEGLQSPLSEDVLHALVPCQIVLRRWDSVNDVLCHLRDERNMGWNAFDVASIAKAVIILEKDISSTGPNLKASISSSQLLLTRILEGFYNSPREHQERLDFSQQRMAHQLSRIFQTIPGSLSRLTMSHSKEPSRLSAPIQIPPEAFNILMQGVVFCHGSTIGKRLWESWCSGINAPRTYRGLHGPSNQAIDQANERVVEPSLQLLRTIVRPVVQSASSEEARRSMWDLLKPNRDSDDYEAKAQEAPWRQGIYAMASSHLGVSQIPNETRDLLIWAGHMYRGFGLSEADMRTEFSSSLVR